MVKKRDRLFFKNTQFIVQLRHFIAQRRKIRVAVRDHTRLQKREKLLLQLVHHIQNFLPVVIRPDHNVDHERNRKTDHRICESMKAVGPRRLRPCTDRHPRTQWLASGMAKFSRSAIQSVMTQSVPTAIHRKNCGRHGSRVQKRMRSGSEKGTGNLRQTFLQRVAPCAAHNRNRTDRRKNRQTGT